MELTKSYGRVGRMIEGPEEDSDSTGRPTESTILDSLELPETHQLKSEQELDLVPLHIGSR